MTLLSESIHSSIHSPLFNDIVDTASKLFHNYFPYCERLFLEAESLLLQPRQPAIIHVSFINCFFISRWFKRN